MLLLAVEGRHCATAVAASHARVLHLLDHLHAVEAVLLTTEPLSHAVFSLQLEVCKAMETEAVTLLSSGVCKCRSACLQQATAACGKSSKDARAKTPASKAPSRLQQSIGTYCLQSYSQRFTSLAAPSLDMTLVACTDMVKSLSNLHTCSRILHNYIVLRLSSGPRAQLVTEKLSRLKPLG